VSAVLRPDAPPPRPMTVGDLDEVLAIERAAYDFPWTPGNFVDSIAAGYWTRLAFDAEGRLAAYAVAMRIVDEMHLLNLTVAPALQGRGLAQAMLDRLQAESVTLGLETLWLEVRVSNARARRLYHWRGLREVGLRRDYYPAPFGEREHAVVMRLTLATGTEAADGVD
jgi:ribosomal-protein-alanine N-acetyltransferase